MSCISKHFTADNCNQIILEQENYSEYVWNTLLGIFDLPAADKIVISEYKLDAWRIENV